MMKVERLTDNDLVNQLYQGDIEFRRLYDHHSELDKQVDKAQGNRFLANVEDLEKLKKEKLRLKDQLEKILQQNRQ